jgi:hypothetical protein
MRDMQTHAANGSAAAYANTAAKLAGAASQITDLINDQLKNAPSDAQAKWLLESGLGMVVPVDPSTYRPATMSYCELFSDLLL